MTKSLLKAVFGSKGLFSIFSLIEIWLVSTFFILWDSLFLWFF